MKAIRLTLTAALLGVASMSTFAADASAEAARRERMDQAYEDYRNPQPGPAARAENSMKRGVHRAGHAIKHGAEKAGHAIGKGVRKTGEAIGRGGEKLEDAATPKP
jgi:hypothetical protein